MINNENSVSAGDASQLDASAADILPFDVIVKTAENDPGQIDEMCTALENAQQALDKRYERSSKKFNEVNKQHPGEYANFDEVCELNDKINNGFGILEDRDCFDVAKLTRIRLCCKVLCEMERGLDYFDEILKDYGTKCDQALAAEYEELNFYRWHFSSVYHDFNNAWLEAYIKEDKENVENSCFP